MKIPDYSLYTIEEVVQAVSQMSPTELNRHAPHLSPEQVAAAAVTLSDVSHPDHRIKMRGLFLGVSGRSQLEALGRVLPMWQFQEILAACHDDQGKFNQAEKLQPILIGLPQPVFYESLTSVQPEEFDMLRGLGETESLQHHLTLLAHELAREAEAKANEILDLKRQIDSYDVDKVSQADIDSFGRRIYDVGSFFQEAFEKLKLALALAWNTSREDLVDRYTGLKENWLRYLRTEIGRPESEGLPSTGIYAFLENHLNLIYGSHGDPYHLDTLTDDDPAQEALTVLGVWYLEDYWELGLLPEIKNVKQLALDPKRADEKAHADHREKLMAMAQANLAKAGLNKVGDFKRAHIYSRRMLARFLKGNHETT